MLENSKQITVVIPTYNGADFLVEAVESALAQSFKDKEIIVVDDGSTDNTSSVIASYQDRIRYIKQENQGAAEARNRGIREAKGEFIAFLDSDDIWLPDKLEKQFAYLQKNPDFGLIYCDVKAIDEQAREYLIPNRAEFEPAEGYIFDKLLIRNRIATSGVLVRKECLLRVGLFDKRYKYSQDYDLWLRLARHYKFGYIDEPLFIYRFRKGGLTSGSESKMYQDHIEILKQMKEIFPELNLSCSRVWKRGLSKHYFEFGCECFAEADYQQAKQRFLSSIRYHRLNLRAWVYFVFTFLPAGLIRYIRRQKKLLKKPKDKRPLRVMHVLISLGTAGLQKNVVGMINTFDKTQFEFSLCCLEDIGEHSYDLPSKLKVFSMNKKPGIAYLLPLKLTWLFLRQRPDIVHTHGFNTQLYAGLAAILARVPILINGEHGDLYLPSQGKLINVSRRILARFTEVIHTTSSNLKKDLVERTGIEARKVVPILNGVDLKRYKITPSTRSRYNFLAEDDIAIGSLGRLEPVRDYALILKAVSKLKPRYSKLKVLFIGDGPLKPDLVSLSQDLRIADRVIFLGQRTDVEQLLNAVDILVHPSKSEGFSNAILEAMACGLPVIASDVGGNPEAVVDGLSGFLFPLERVDLLIDRLRRLIENRDLRKSLGRNGRKKVEADFSLSRMLSEYQALYLGALRVRSLKFITVR